MAKINWRPEEVHHKNFRDNIFSLHLQLSDMQLSGKVVQEHFRRIELKIFLKYVLDL